MPLLFAYKSKEGKDQESIQSCTTPDPRHHMGKRQKHKEISPQGLLIPRVVRQLAGYLGLCYFSILTGLLTLYFDSDLIFGKILIANIRIHHECEGGIEKFVLRITDGQHEACRMMTKGDCEGRIFRSHPHTNNGYFSCSPLNTHFYIGRNMKKASRKS